MTGMSKKILILMSDTGGGHRASAEAISEAMAHLYGDTISVRIVDAWKNHSPWPINRIGDSYPWLVSNGLWLWNMLWHTDNKMSKMYRAERPDLVVTVHPIINPVASRVLRKMLKSDIPYAIVVTDLVRAHPAWFCCDADYYIVPTEAAYERALRYGVPPERVEVVGQPVGLKFAAGMGEKLYLRGVLHLDLERPAVLVIGGGEGMGPVYEIARAIASNVPTAQLIIVAGRNAALKEKLEATRWEIPTRIYGFVTNMPELMGASDLLVTKAGPGTLSEAFIAGLPVVISSFIPGQEEGNVDYTLEHHAGVYASDPDEIGHLIRDWLRPGGETLNQMAANAAGLARPEAALVIAQRLHHLLTHKNVKRPIASRSSWRYVGVRQIRRFRLLFAKIGILHKRQES
jgi:1,2-diacylglycerol 3-beta-galactosyltransferase